MRTIDILGRYIGLLRLERGSPFVHRYVLDEYTGLCRTSTALFVRLLPLRWALVLGRWKPSGRTQREMVEHLMAARDLDLYGDDGELDPRFEQSARNQVAKHAQDPDEEWKILEMLELDR